VIAPFAARKTYPVVDFISSLFWYEASENPLKEIAVSGAYLYVIPYDRVPDKYRNIRVIQSCTYSLIIESLISPLI
jgi:hypothetical protein